MLWLSLFSVVASLSVLLMPLIPVLADEQSEPHGIETRIPWTTSRILGTPDPPSKYTVQRAFPKLKFDSPVYIAQEPGTNRFMVAELAGKIYAFTAETPDNEHRELFLDTKRQIYSFSFHPKYEQNGEIFVFSPSDPADKAEEKDRKSRVSRFRCTLENPRSSSLESEQIIVEWLAGGHNGGEAIIGPDGYLYVCTGDTTSGSDPKSTGQGVDDLYSVMMRLDVENPPEGQAYGIPADNPFIDFPDARPEIWAFGFRNPWRMSFDERTGDLWVGDVGQDLWEMIRLVQKGGNYGWSVQEGSHPFHPEKPIGPGPILPPVIEHHHTECRSITGGYVYYGPKFPELQGAYFYGDYEYGQVWALRYDGQRVTWKDELANTSLRIASFGVGRDGQIYLIDHPTGEIHTLERAPEQVAGPPFPKQLSETGLFTSTASHQPAPGLIPYSVNAPQWTDGGTKERYAAVPGELKADFVEGKGTISAWSFPDGTVLMETISMAINAEVPDQTKRIETRLLVRQQSHWLGYSYLWNDEQTDAELAAARGIDLKLTVVDQNSPQGTRQQTWHVPGRDECMACHSRAAGFVLGFSTPQMNRDHLYGGVPDNQLRAWNHIGMFSKPVEKPAAEYDVLPNPYQDHGDLNARARAWLQVNCSVCHVADGGGNAKLEVKYFQENKDLKLFDERPLHGTFDLQDARLIAPGDPFASVLFYRLSKLGRGRMPHVSSRQHDEQGLRLIHDWILGLTSLPPAEGTSAAVTESESVSTRVAAEFSGIQEKLNGLAEQPPEIQAVAVTELLSSTRSAFIVATAVTQNPGASGWRQPIITAAMAHVNPNVRDLFERFVPEEQRVFRLGEGFDPHVVLDLAGDAERGRQIFSGSGSQCRNCHRIKQEGGTIGPELTEIGRKLKAEELLESMAEPSRRIDPKYIPQLLQTTDGRVMTGILAEKTSAEVVINVLEGAETRQLRIPVEDVEELVPQAKSLMPDRLLRDLTPQQAADLIAFLTSLK